MEGDSMDRKLVERLVKDAVAQSNGIPLSQVTDDTPLGPEYFMIIHTVPVGLGIVTVTSISGDMSQMTVGSFVDDLMKQG